MLGYKQTSNYFLYPVKNEHREYIDEGHVKSTQLILHNGGLKEGWHKVSSFLKNLGPKFINGIFKGADWLADHPDVTKKIQETAKDITGINMPIEKAVETIKDVKEKNIPKLIETGKSIFDKWKENRDKIKASNLPEKDKKEVDNTTNELLKLNESQASGLGKNAVFANLVDFSKKSKKGGLTYGIPMGRLGAIGETKRPMKISIKDAGRLFATGSFGGELKPEYVVSKIEKDGKKGTISKTKIETKNKSEKEFDEIFDKMF